MAAHSKLFDVSELEAWILESIDHVGWYAYLWFPIVQREVLNFGSKVPDADVHVAFASLIKKGALEVSQARWGDIPEWKPAPLALEEAREVLSLGLDLMHRKSEAPKEGREK